MAGTDTDGEALPAAFYTEEAPGVFRATGATQGPWEPGSQHGGPPAALLATVAEREAGGQDLRTVRLALDFFGPVPVAPVTVSVRVLRPGRRIRLVEAELAHEGRVAAVARIWQHAVSATGDAVELADGALDAAGVARDGFTFSGRPAPVRPERDAAGLGLPSFGYGRAMEWRATGGGAAARPGPGAVWARPRIPVIAGTELTGRQCALLLADSANGISLSLPMDRYLSMPTSLNVALLRHPRGPWVHMAARTLLGGDGSGLTTAELADEHGLVGVVDQPLLIAARG